jgi:hypothetical protein
MSYIYNSNKSGTGRRDHAFGGGNIEKLTEQQKRKKKPKTVTQKVIQNVTNAGFIFQKSQQISEVVGSYTQNRLRQKRIGSASTLAKYAVGIAMNPVAGLIYAGSDMAYRSAMMGIEYGKKNAKAQYYKELSGNNSNSGSRYKGKYV